MKNLIALLSITVILVSSAMAQDTYYSLFTYSHEIPHVTLNDQTTDLQKSLLPNMYTERSASGDIQWVQENDSELVAFWENQGDTILHILTELSGIEWVETEFDIYLVRYFSSIGSGSPLVLPLGGTDNGKYLVATPDIEKQKLLLIYLLSKRMLMQADRPGNALRLSIRNHPLMQPTPYRFDNLAMSLALATSYSVLGVDTTYNVTSSSFWKKSFPGREIFEKYFEKDWVLTPDQTLADYISNESSRSKLVIATRTPSLKNNGYQEIKTFVEDLPLKGRFGFAVKLNDAAHTEVSEIDEYRLAYACGLRKGDVIRRVDGKLVRNHKQIIEYLLEKFQDGGSVMQINRMGETMEIIIQPLDIDLYDDSYYIDEYNQGDTIYFDTLDPNIGN